MPSCDRLANSLTIRLDNGKTVELNPDQSRHIEYGYAVASAKGVSADRVIFTEAAMPDLAALSHATRDVAVYTSDMGQSQAIGHDRASIAQLANTPANLLKPKDQHEFDLSQGFVR